MNLKFAWRNVWRNKSRSIIIMASVAIGLFAGLFVEGLYVGMMRSRVRIVIDTEVAHLQIHHPDFKQDYDPNFTVDLDRIKDSLNKVQSIRKVAFRSITQGMLATTTGSAGVQIFGIGVEEEGVVSSLNDKIKEGETLDPDKKNGILIGRKLADKMKVKLGSKLVLTFTDRENNVISGAFRISGIYQTINTPLDERFVYIHRERLNEYLGLGDTCHEVAILLNRDEELDATKTELLAQFPEYSVKTWRENSPETDLMVGTINQYSTIIIIIIMIALAFGIINTMLMSVLERTREIGMLSALGMNRIKVFSLILGETFILTLIGVPLGVLMTWISINHYSVVGIDISSFSEEAMSSFGFTSIIYPEFPWENLTSVLVIVVGTALISSIFPSLKAIKLQPADALRQ
ncbi:FtsX-like permease family protein [Algoriphagus sp. CAU 1675]|uniref:ABC transporter permease n=1 Tax=Algoriphagus sp. CAU 1675 TaxID=3032597 RepID=UPI0023DCE940|nr:FtsX-like permease family protein [Algoriphagus sp. CAU 1675]MDF2157943.1 FtsX-like permease family protein [Algoriphagus sp. CAU 1675]